MAGRPKCSFQCCQLLGADEVRRMYEEEGKSSRFIAGLVGVSDVHIRKRLHEMGVRMKSRGAYPASRGGRRNKVHPLALISDEILFLTPVDILMEKYLCERETVWRFRKERRKK